MKFKKVEKRTHVPGLRDPDFVFYCPGCKCDHGVWTTERNGRGAIWSFNGNVESPTVTPSILVTVGHDPEPNDICHSFVTDGRIQFLGDCTHELKNQTVEIPEYENI